MVEMPRAAQFQQAIDAASVKPAAAPRKIVKRALIALAAPRRHGWGGLLRARLLDDRPLHGVDRRRLRES